MLMGLYRFYRAAASGNELLLFESGGPGRGLSLPTPVGRRAAVLRRAGVPQRLAVGSDGDAGATNALTPHPSPCAQGEGSSGRWRRRRAWR